MEPLNPNREPHGRESIRSPDRNGGDSEDRGPPFNVYPMIILLVLVVVGVVLFFKLRQVAHSQDCVSGRKNCAPLGPPSDN